MMRLLIAAAVVLAAGGEARAQGFSDTWMGVRDGAFVSNPGGETGSRNVNKIIVNFGHFDVWDYGSNFVNVDVLFSDANEPALNSGGGSTELYGLYRGQLSPDKIFGLNTKFGPISAINLEFGGDAETENTAFAPDKKLLVFGPNFHFDLPDYGFITLGVHVSKEWNNNGIAGNLATLGIPHSNFHTPVNFAPTPEFELVWLYHMGWTGLPLDFQGFVNVVMPKGHTGFGGNTYTEILAVPRLSLDIGKVLGGKPHKVDLYVQCELWEHKFGNASQLSGSEQVSPQIGIEYHF
jgi:nucleoside-specific outer membrane channel protein Tsx